MADSTPLKQESDKIAIPASLLIELKDAVERLDDILETIEVLSDKSILREIRKSMQEIEKGEYQVIESPEDVDKLLE